MTTTVVTGPVPIVTPADIAGNHGATDAKVAGMIAAVQRTIDGPHGWLGRALGKQTLRLELAAFPCHDIVRLYGPVIGSVVVTYLDRDEVTITVDDTNYRVMTDAIQFRRSFSKPSTLCAPDAFRIQYEAGYDTADVPPEAKQAVILMTQQMKAASAENLFLRAEEVDGVGRFEYTVSEQAGNIIRATAERLLQGLMVYG
jgi:hypothetical protein